MGPTGAPSSRGAGGRLAWYELPPERNPFYSLCADVTHRCNMACNNCYIPNRTIPDMDSGRLLDLLSRLPARVELRLIGGEPTLRDDLPELIASIRRLGHRPMLLTNGLRLAEPGYARELYRAGLRTVNLSLNGADDDAVYRAMDRMDCAARKLQALDACHEAGMFINTNTILARGLNEHVPARLWALVRQRGIHAVMRFRNVGQLGRHMETHAEALRFDELVSACSAVFGVPMEEILRHRNVNGYDEERTVLFPLEPGLKRKTAWVKITDWSPAEGSIPDPDSRRRGRITKDFTVAPFFEDVARNEGGY